MFRLFVLLTIFINGSLQNLGDDIALRLDNQSDTERILSRERRYLVFPQGSSFQVVYCFTIPTISPDNIFTIGTTAAMAWELPSEPLQKPFKKHVLSNRLDEDPNIKLSGSKTNDWIDREQNKIPERTYNDPFSIKKFKTMYSTINNLMKKPVSSYSTINRNSDTSNKRSQHKNTLNHYRSYENENYNKYYNYHYQQPVTTYVHPVYHQVYRRTRRDLYAKLEKFVSTDWKECLLKAICRVSQANKEKGTFLEEIVKVVLRAKPHEDYKDDEYDRAANKNHNCTQEFPTCDDGIFTSMFSFS